MSENGNDLREFMEDYKKNATFWFGKYKGVPMCEIPKDYLIWLKTQEFYKKMSKSLKKAINYNIPKKQ